MGSASISGPAPPSPATWLLVFAGPALRSSLLGGLLVAEAAIGEELGLSSIGLSILFECVVFGNLLAVIILPSLISGWGIRTSSLLTIFLTLAYLAAGVVFASWLPPGLPTTVVMYASAAVLGFLVAVPSPITQTLLNDATPADSHARRSLQSAWSAGLPVGFVVASLIGGILLQYLDWWSALLVPLLFAILCALSLLDRRVFACEVQSRPDPAPPFSEIAVVVLALVVFEIWTAWGSLRSWFDIEVVVAFVATIAATAFAVKRLRSADMPIISVEPYAVTGFAAAAVLLFLYQIPTTAEYEVLLLTELDKVSSEMIGNRTAIGNVGQVVGTALAAGLMYRRLYGLALAAGFGLTIVALGSYVAYPWLYGDGYIIATRTIAGFGSGLITPVLFVLALFRMPVPLQLAAGTWLVLATIGGTEIGLNVFDFVMEVADHVSGSNLTGYLTVECTQLAFGVGTAALAALLVLRRKLDIRTAAVAAAPPQGRD
ncbi:MFS transporter [Microbaculum marinum]|uniref:MFS transporter n=1 Tax=Microbaculum marinum TaxID=1764581 RepID=A0AAW9RXG4_9HYPH